MFRAFRVGHHGHWFSAAHEMFWFPEVNIPEFASSGFDLGQTLWMQ
jgi:hypothetical protein